MLRVCIFDFLSKMCCYCYFSPLVFVVAIVVVVKFDLRMLLNIWIEAYSIVSTLIHTLLSLPIQPPTYTNFLKFGEIYRYAVANLIRYFNHVHIHLFENMANLWSITWIILSRNVQAIARTQPKLPNRTISKSNHNKCI